MIRVNLRRRVQASLDPARVAADARIRQARQRLTAGDEALARRFDEAMARRIGAGVEALAARYEDAMSARLDRIVALRDELAGVYESVLAGEQVRTDAVRATMDRLSGELDGFQSPREFLEGLSRIDLPETPAGRAPEPVRALTVGEAVAGQTAALRALDADTRRAVTTAADLAPDRVRAAVVAETEQGMARGIDAVLARVGDRLPPAEQARLRAGLEALNPSRRAAEARRAGAPPAQPPADLRLAVAAAVGAITDPGLRRQVARSRYLAREAYYQPDMLAAYWRDYHRRPRGYPFWRYVLYRGRGIRGLLGEFEAAFRLGDDMALLKAPDAAVFLPGTDLVAVNLRTGEIWLIDNKAFTSTDVVRAVSALTRNLPRNLADDVAEFTTTFDRPDSPPGLAAAVQRLATANEAVQRAVVGLDPRARATQERVAAVLADHGVRLVVTNAEGRVREVSDALRQVGIELADVADTTTGGEAGR